jgi:branched-chain amino acid transport system ATP-binding protein
VGTMSGGERKMLTIGCGLMSSPSLLMVDEPSLGLAPKLIEGVFETMDVLNKRNGMTILIVEQKVNKILKVTNRAYVLENGKIVMEGQSADLVRNGHVRKTYLGL